METDKEKVNVTFNAARNMPKYLINFLHFYFLHLFNSELICSRVCTSQKEKIYFVEKYASPRFDTRTFFKEKPVRTAFTNWKQSPAKYTCLCCLKIWHRDTTQLESLVQTSCLWKRIVLQTHARMFVCRRTFAIHNVNNAACLTAMIIRISK